MNVVALMGRLTADPDVRQAGETQVVKFTLAVDRFRKEPEHSADFIRCVAFGKTAEFLGKYVRKGTKIGLTGRIQTGSYDHRDGYKVYTTEVAAERIYFADRKQDNGDGWENAEALEDPFGLN